MRKKRAISWQRLRETLLLALVVGQSLFASREGQAQRLERVIPLGEYWPLTISGNDSINRFYLPVITPVGSGSLVVLDGNDSAVRHVDLQLSGFNGFDGVVANRSTGEVLVLLTSAPSILSVVDPLTDEVATVSVPEYHSNGSGSPPLARWIDVNHQTGVLYLADQVRRSIGIFDPATRLFSDLSTSDLYPMTLAVNSSTNTVFVVAYSPANESVLLSIDTEDLTVSSTSLEYESFFPFSGIAVNERTNKVYLGGFGMERGIAVIDGADLSSRFVPTGDLEPVDIAVNPETNQTLALCRGLFLGGKSFLVTMDGATERFESFDLDDLVPGGIAVNRFTNRIYVVDSKFPGSQILVFAPDGCSSTTTSLDELRGEVGTLSTAKRVIRSLTSLLDDVELALDQNRPDLGRSRLALFQRKLVALSNTRTGGTSPVPLHEANRVLCSASNVLLGVEKP